MSCSDGGPYGGTGTITDTNGDHTLTLVARSFTESEGHIGYWYASYKVSASPTLGTTGCESSAETTCVYYYVKCAGNINSSGRKVTVARLWQVFGCTDGDTCAYLYSQNADGGCFEGPYGMGPVLAVSRYWLDLLHPDGETVYPDYPPPSSCGVVYTYDSSAFNVVPTSCDPLALTATLTPAANSPLDDPVDPLGGSVSISIPKVSDESPCFPGTCAPCNLPSGHSLYLSWSFTDGGGGCEPFPYDSGTSTWTYASFGSSATAGPNYAALCVDDGGSAFPWTSPLNARYSDSTYATATTTNGQGTNKLLWTDFGFGIPGDAVIDGLQFEILTYCTSTIADQTAKWYSAGSTVGSELAHFFTYTTPTVITYGGPTSLGGWSPTAALVNDPGFGFRWSAVNDAKGQPTVYVDYGRPTIWFHTQDWSAVLSCSGGADTLTITIGEGSGVAQTLTTYTCVPLDLVWTATGATATAGFAGFEVSSASCAFVCSPCAIPLTDLTVSWVNPTLGNGSATLTFDGVSLWSTGCVTTGGGSSAEFFLYCASDGTHFQVGIDNLSTSCAGIVGVYDSVTSGGGVLNLTSSSCSPYDLEWAVGVGTPLYAAGYRSFTVTP